MGIKDLTGQLSPDSRSNAPLVDIVAIHGLYEGALETWTDPKTSVLWLRDLFPHEKLNARVLAYEYTSESLISPGDGTTDRTLPYATSLIAQLCADRELSDASDRPIIFICHGFGGILVKRALVFSSTSRARNVEHRRAIYLSTYAIIFMGTPHTGMSKDVILSLQRDNGVGLSQFMLSLLKHSEMLQEITDQFAPIMKQFSIHYFWEEIVTRFRDFKAYVVDEDSAAPAWDIADRCGISATHSGMVKYKNCGEPGYPVVLGALVRCIKAAPRLIELRWANDQELLADERQREMDTLSQYYPPHITSRNVCQTDVNEFYIVPRCSTNYFTGRKLQAQTLKDSFGPIQEQSKRHEHRIFVIYGLGGSGKTQFCLKYLEDNRSFYWGIFWIDASNEENAESGFAYLGQQAGKGATFAAGIHWLSNCTKPWFLIIDNADDPDMDVSKYFPTGGKGHILITTRNPGTLIHATAGDFHFRGMDPEEAITLLLKSAHMPNQSEASDIESIKLAQGIASELGYLALALTHAGATIRRNIYTLERYLHFYLGYRREMMSSPHIKNADDANIITTWEIPFRRIAIRESIEYRDAVEIMHIFAFMHFESIPEDIFQKFWNAINGTEPKLINNPGILQNNLVWNEEAHARVRRALRILCDYSIIDHDPDKGFCSLHPVVHAWARGRLTLPGQKEWLGCTTAILAQCISPNLEASGQKFRRMLLPHIDSCLRALGSLFPGFPKSVERAAELDRFASVYAENGLWKQARALQLKVIDVRVRKLGKRHKDTIQAQRSLGYIHWNLFEIESAIEIQAKVMKSQWRSRPSVVSWLIWPPWKPRHVSYCIALSDLTQTLWLAGKQDLSKLTGESAVEGLMKNLGPDDPITLSATFNLARTYLHLGDFKKGHELLKLVVKKRKKFFGPDHPDTLMARNELGLSYRAFRKMAVAERLVRNVLESRKRILGEEHAYTLWSVNDLSKIFCDRGHPGKAVSMLEEIVPTVIRTLGEAHVGMVLTNQNLARAYALCKRWGEAEVLLRKLSAAIPTNHPGWIHAISGHVHAREKLGRLEETEEDCKKMLDVIIETNLLPLDNPQTLSIAQLLVRIYHAQGHSDKILALQKRVPGVKKHDDAKDGLSSMLYKTNADDGESRPRNMFY